MTNDWFINAFLRSRVALHLLIPEDREMCNAPMVQIRRSAGGCFFGRRDMWR
jgi:hypothetical protein